MIYEVTLDKSSMVLTRSIWKWVFADLDGPGKERRWVVRSDSSIPLLCGLWGRGFIACRLHSPPVRLEQQKTVALFIICVILWRIVMFVALPLVIQEEPSHCIGPLAHSLLFCSNKKHLIFFLLLSFDRCQKLIVTSECRRQNNIDDSNVKRIKKKKSTSFLLGILLFPG